MTIRDIYQKAIDRGVLSREYTVEQFEKLLRNENLRRKYWEYADKNFSGFYSNDYNTFSKNTDNLLTISNTEDTNPSVSANPAPTTAQEDSINLAKQNEGEQQYNVVTPVVSSPTQTMDYNAMTLDELQQVRSEQLRKAQASKERRVSEQKLWEQEHPFLASVAAMRGGGAYTDKSVGETLKEVDADQFAEDSKDQNAVKEALGRKLYESNYNNIGGEVERMQSVVANISREDKKLGERKDLDKAEYVLDQAHRLATAPSKYDPSTNGLVNFGKGIADNTNRDLIPAVELIRDVNINNAIKKMNDGKELTEGERALILSYITYSDVQQARQYDLPMGYQAGAAAAESIPFMAEMLLTKGASKLAVSKVIRIMKAAGKTADQINDFAKWMNLGAKGIKVDDVVYGAVEEGAKRTVGSVARNTASELVGTTLQTAAMPSTYQGMVEDNMRTRLATRENDIEGYNMNNLRNFGNAWVQTLTERKGGELIDWGLGKIMPFDKIWHTKAGNQMVANKFFQSPVAETLEEYLAAVINYGRSFNPLYSEESNAQLKQEAEDMFTAEGLGTTFLSMLPNTILGGAVNLYDVHKTSNDYNNARAKVLGELVKSGATQEQAENILMQIETSNEEEMREKFGILYSHFNIENAGGAGAKAAEEYIKAAQAYQFSVADLANKFANLTPEEQAQAQQEMQDFTSQVRQKAVEHEARMFAQTQAGEATNEDGNIYQVTRADGTTPEGSRMYISAGNVVTTDDGKGQQIIDRTQSSKDVFVTTYDADGNANVEHVALDELDLLFAPTSRQQVEDELYSMFMQEYAMTQQMAAQQAAQQATQAQGQQVVGEDNGQQPLGATEGEQASNIEGRQFTNGQQTITASNPDSNGNVTLSAPVTLSNGVVTDQVMPQQVFDDLMSGLISEEGWQEVIPQPAAQGQTQGQQQAPIVWSEMDANQATATVVERSKGDKERAKKFAQKQVEVKTKALQEAQAEMDAFEGDDLDAFNAVQDKVDAAQAEVDKWTAVANGIDAYVAPVQPSGNISATSASGNGVVTEGTARQSTSNPQQSANSSQNTLQNEKKSVSLQEKKRKRAQEIIDKIHGGNNTVYLFDMNDIIKVLEDAGVSQISIDNVKKQIAQMREGDVIGGFQIGNKIFINYDQEENEIRRKYIHERQHILTTPQLANKIASSMSWEELFDVVCNLCGSRAYQDRNAIDLAHELISFSMEWVYEYDNNQIVRGVLKNYGLNEEQILTLINLGNEQRKDNTLSRARRAAYVNNSRQGSGRQDGRDFSENSTRDMEGQGVRPSITSESRTERTSEVGQDTALEESGIQVNDETGDARFSVNYRLDANQIDILAEQIAERVGVSKAKAKKWLKAETSLAALCMQEDNVAALYYFADGRYGAIKNNSDYPQGTVDFNNICRKRLDFTNIYLSLQREFPNKVFTAKDLETIRQIMIEDGLEVACGLCYVEDRRQLLGEIANEFRGFLKDRVIPEDLSATKKEVMQKVLDMVGDDTYIPTIAQLLEAGAYELRNSHPNIFEAFVVFNNSRGMQSGRLFEGYAEYKREILDWSDKKVKQVNDAGGLRIFSFSDFEAHHLIDIVQIISDAASKGVMIQGYTKVPEFARAIRNTKVKLNRSLIPLGDTGIQEVDGKKVLAYDTTEGIDVNSENFLDESNNPNVGNVLVGINDEQIRMAMDDTNVDYIIPFHTGLKKDILLQKKIGAWVNYKNSQTEKDATTGSSKTADGKKVVGVNIYTDVLQAAENEGTPIKNRKEFVEYFLKVCKERGLVPRFEQFLARGKNGEYKYTKGYEKLLVDFKMFDKRGNILPQEPVVPIFDDAFNQQIIEDYVKGTKETKEYESTKEKIKENLQLNDYTDDLAESESQVRYSIVTDKKKIEELEASEKMIGYRNVVLNEDGTFGSPMASSLQGEGKKVKTQGFELNKWEQAEENPDLADENGKIDLVKPDGKSIRKVDYNPYIHNRPNKVNKQFKQAWERPNLVYIETEIAKTDLDEGYHAEKAKKSVGIHKWNGGKLILSRYDKPIRIVPWKEVADDWVKAFKKRGVEFDIIPPALLPILHERGVEILPPHKNMGEECNAAYEQWKTENSNPRFSITAEEDKAYADAVARGDMATAQRMVIEAAKKAIPNTKIVDADGNPMIVYHDTNATELVNIETGENWNDLDWRAKDEWRKREDFDEYWEERDFYTFNNKRSRRSIEMPAYFFSTKEDEYHEYGDRTIRAFLNITNPAIDPTIENVGTYDYAGEDAMNKLIELGHDGFIRTIDNGEWDEVNAFFPNQIKSAEPATYDDNGELIPLSERFNNDKSDIRFSIIGERGAANLDRAEEATTRLDNLAVAREMESANKDAKTIKMATGWERGADGKWRYEIEDIKLKDITTLKSSDNVTLGDIVEYNELFTAYPDMSDIVVDKNVSNGDIASYNGNIGLSAELLNMPYTAIRTALVHEIQHAIQDREGFAGGVPSPNAEYFVKRKAELEKAINALENDFTIEQLRELAKTTDDAYLRDVYVDALMLMAEGATMDDVREVYTNEYNGLNEQERQSTKEYVNAAGEVESRNASSRLGMSAEERRATLLSETEDVARKDQLFIFDAMEGANNEIRFSVSNTNQRIFVSNAERAVESIKQEKATPQQWKAMIEKQGGLKAGEDKWLGLSEWLDSKIAPAQEGETMGEAARRVAKNTIAKQEILDYIAEHQIQIEEVEYMDADDVADIDLTPEQQEKYDQFVDEYKTIQEEDGLSEEEAFEELVDRYGEDFTMAFFVDSEGELQIQGDYDGRTADAALYYLGGEQINVINRTRLTYTTKGLKNNREIALTVPTIERWNADDTIHFGDAGDGRAIAWVRFGETNAPVKEYADFYEYQKKLQKKYFPERTIQSLSGEDLGVLTAEERNEFDRLKAAKERIPYKESRTNRVLVIDEIQSKRHQEGREKGYATKKDRDIKKKIAKLTDQQDAIFDAMRAREEGRAGITNFTEEETAELKRLGEEIKQLQSELSANNGIVPDAPFDKNWHELAFKRMLRYAAENGFDYVAWTTGAQQAERYDLGKQFDSIEREDNPSINGRRFALNGANYFTFVVNEEGVITESDMSEIQGKPLADVVGKDLAIRMMSLEDGDAIEGADLRIGGEGMKGFYDRMLPSFVSKYTKKWGAKVQDINLPNLEESAQTMHAVNVTQEMKDSVMEGQVMFSVRNRTEDLRMSEENGIFAEQYRWGDALLDEDYISEAYDKEMDAFYDAIYTIENPLTEVERNKAMQSKARAIEEFLLKLNYNTPNLHVISSLENMQDELENAGVQQDVIDALIQEEEALREKKKMSWGMKVFDSVYIFAEPMQSLTEVQLTFAHEMQHIENERNKKLLADIVDVTSPQELNNILIAFGSTEYSKYLDQKEDGFIALADEVVAFMMEYGFALGKDGNLAERLKRDGLENTELINLLQQEYERRKEDTPFVLVKNQRGNKKHSNNRVGTSNDGSNLQGRSNKVARPKFGGFATGSMPQTRGELAKRRVEQQQLQKLRDDAVSKLLSTTEVDVPDINLDEETFYTPRFSVAPTPTPTETKGEYLKRYMEWRESQVNENAVNAYKEELKKGTKFWRTFVKKIVDRNIAIEKFQDFVLKISKSLDLEGKISINTNAFLDVSMAVGRAHSANERFKTRYQTPMMDAIKAIVKSKKLDHIDIRWNGIDGKKNGKRLTASELVGIYCQAKDVQEAIEMGLPDRGQQGFKDNLLMDGNEVSHEDVIRTVEDALAGTNLKDNLWKAVNQATLFSLIYQRRHRFISRKTFDEYKSRKFYVPERGWRERDLEDRERKYVDDKGNEGIMDSPFNVALKKAKGRSSLASDPFAYIVSIAKSTIAAVEKNRVKQKFLQFLFDNGQVGLNTKAWTIKQVYLVKVKNKDGEDIGTVATYEKPSNPDDIAGKVANDLKSLKQLAQNQKNQHAVVVVKDGEEYVIWLEDEQLANALNRNYAGIKFQNSPFGRAMRGATGYYSGQLTQYNPEFAASNFVRDYILSQISNFAVQDKPFEHFARFNYNLVRIMPELVTYVGAHTIGREVFLNTKKGKYMQEYFALGAQTGFSYLEDVSVLRDLIDKVVNKNDIVKYATAVPKFMFIDMLSSLTELSELSIRMTQYITCREKGMSARAAAIEAKKITVDFDTRGELSSVFSGLWSFFNASVQGTNKIARDVKRKPLRATLTYAGFAGLLFYLGYLLTNLFPDDPEEEEFWNEYVRRTNFTVGEYKIPMAHFFRIFWGGGVTMALKEQGRLTETQAAGEMTRMVFDEIIPQSPFQVQNLFEYNNDADSYDISLEGYERGLMPSVFMPIYDVKQNEDFLGRKISKEPYIKSEEGKYKAKKYERTESTNEKYIKIADWLSGGDPNVLTKGVDDGNPIDINGTELQYIVEGYTKQFATLIDTYNLVTKAIKEKEIQTKDIPFLRKFKKDYINESAYSQEYWTLYNYIDQYKAQRKEVANPKKEAIYDDIRYRKLLKDKPNDNDKHTPQEVRELMELNKQWRELLDED